MTDVPNALDEAATRADRIAFGVKPMVGMLTKGDRKAIAARICDEILKAMLNPPWKDIASLPVEMRGAVENEKPRPYEPMCKVLADPWPEGRRYLIEWKRETIEPWRFITLDAYGTETVAERETRELSEFEVLLSSAGTGGILDHVTEPSPCLVGFWFETPEQAIQFANAAAKIALRKRR